MNKNLILVSRKPIVIQIFTLVCKKLKITLEILNEVQVDHKVDIIIIDNDFIDDRFNIVKSYAKLMGAISKEELPFGSANDFIIPLPFLPSSLEQILLNQLSILNQRKNTKTYISNLEVPFEKNKKDDSNKESSQKEPAVEYLEELASDIADDIDNSLVDPKTLNKGGILDKDELARIQDIMTSKSSLENELDKKEPEIPSETQWTDLSTIIDQAIDEVSTVNQVYSKFEKNPITVLLNNYDIEELTPLLNKLDQDIIDSLADGYEIHLQIKLAQVKKSND